jgi:hypothetical protein
LTEWLRSFEAEIGALAAFSPKKSLKVVSGIADNS